MALMKVFIIGILRMPIQEQVWVAALIPSNGQQPPIRNITLHYTPAPQADTYSDDSFLLKSSSFLGSEDTSVSK